MEVYLASIKRMNLTKVRESDEHAKRAAVNLLVRTIPPKSTFTKSEVRNVLRDPTKHLPSLHPNQQNELLSHIASQMNVVRNALKHELPSTREKIEGKVTFIQPLNDLKRGKALDAFRRIRTDVINAQYAQKKSKKV